MDYQINLTSMAMLLGNAQEERCFSHGEKGETKLTNPFTKVLYFCDLSFPLFVIGIQL
jgi:hypothetical protein